MTRGVDTTEIPRTQYPGWCWDWEFDGEQSPIDPCLYEDGWDAILIGFPTCYDGPGYSPTLGMVISSDMVQFPWTKTSRPQHTQEQLLHSAGQALASSLAMRGASSPASGQLAFAPPPPPGRPPSTLPAIP
eukprot:1405481-Pyramimonas_sp.AAC.1